MRRAIGVLLAFALAAWALPATAQQKTLTWTAGQVGGGWYAQAGGFVELLKSKDPSFNIKVIPGAGIQNMSKIQQAETATFFQDVDQGRYPMFLLAWIMDYPDEEDILNIHFDSESPNNNTFYKNTEVDQLLRDALTEPNKQRRVQLYQQAEQMLIEDVPAVFISHSISYVLVKPHIQGYVLTPVDIALERYLSIDPSKIK